MNHRAGTENRSDGSAKTGARAGVENDHAATRPIVAAKAENPAYSAPTPIAPSIRSISFHLAIRSERVKLPTFNCPAFQPVARCAMVTSSLSPERAETIVPQPRCAAASSAAFASVTVRSEEHTSELQSLMRHSYSVFCLKTKNTQHTL